MDLIHLKKPDISKANALEKSIYNRCSTRSFSKKPVKLDTLSKILWSAQGITGEAGRRTIPSAGAIYPLELFVITKNIPELDNGIYYYHPQEHALELKEPGDHTKNLTSACFHQQFIEDAAFTIIITGDFERTKKRYGPRGERYVFMEAGHACQNMSLVAANTRIGTVVIGAFKDPEVSKVLNLGDWYPIAVMPFGHINIR
ncbi:MAG: SagB/ThcOx family dehydrogenase [archaeon]